MHQITWNNVIAKINHKKVGNSFLMWGSRSLEISMRRRIRMWTWLLWYAFGGWWWKWGREALNCEQGSCGIDRFFSHLNLTQATQPSAHSARNSCTLPVTLAAAEQRSSRICPRGCAQPGHELSLTAVPCWVGWGLSGLSQIELKKETINGPRVLVRISTISHKKKLGNF